MPLKDALEQTVNESNWALYYQVKWNQQFNFLAHTQLYHQQSQKVESVRKYPEYDCRLLEPWVTTLPVSSSPALPKGSGLWPILFLAMLRASQASECDKTALYYKAQGREMGNGNKWEMVFVTLLLTELLFSCEGGRCSSCLPALPARPLHLLRRRAGDADLGLRADDRPLPGAGRRGVRVGRAAGGGGDLRGGRRGRRQVQTAKEVHYHSVLQRFIFSE